MGHTPEEKGALLALFAGEGIFFIRFVAGMPMTDKRWDQIWKELIAFKSGKKLPRAYGYKRKIYSSR
jgi:hypothetical protein